MPTYRVEIRSSARKELAALPRDVLRRVDAAILGLAEHPRPAGCKALQGSEGLLRIRVGDYRVVYRVEDDVLVVLLVKIGHRREIYRRR